MKSSFLSQLLLVSTILSGVWLTATASNSVGVDQTFIEPGETISLGINLVNEDEFYGFQMNIQFPEGLEAVVVNNKADVHLSSRFSNSFSLVSNLNSKGLLRLGGFSSDHSAITGDSGTIFTVQVTASEDFKGGILEIGEILFTNYENQDVSIPSFSVNLKNTAINTFSIPDFSVMIGGSTRVQCLLDNEVPFSAFQLDLILPEGLNIVNDSFILSTRAGDSHTLSYMSYNDGLVRIVCYSLANSIFSGDSGPLFEFEISAEGTVEFASGTIKVRDIIFSTASSREFTLLDSNTEVTIINTIPIESINISCEECTLKVGESIILIPTISPEDADNVQLVWSSSDEKVAVVDEDGNVTAIAVGEAVIRVADAANSEIFAECKVSVEKALVPLEGLTLSETELTLNPGQEAQLTVTLDPEEADNVQLVWTSSDEKVATVDDEGNVVAVAVGEAVISVADAANPEIFAECKVTVEKSLVPLEGLTLSETELTLNPDDSAQLTVTLDPDDADNVQLVWSSSDEKVATVDEEGNAVAVAVGEAVIRVADAANSEIFAECKVSVEKALVPLEGLALSETEITLNPGQEAQLSVTFDPDDADNVQLVWTSSDEKVATVDDEGNVVAVAVGEAVISVADAANPEIFAECKVTVEKSLVPLEGLTLSETELTLNPDDSAQLTVTLDPDNADNVQLVWSSSDEKVANVDEEGIVTALAVGEAVIRVADASNPEIFAECVVKVNIETGVEVISNKEYSINSEGRSVFVSGLTTPYEIALYSMDGVMLRHEICKDSSFKIEIPSNGVYLLVVDGMKYKIHIR